VAFVVGDFAALEIVAGRHWGSTQAKLHLLRTFGHFLLQLILGIFCLEMGCFKHDISKGVIIRLFSGFFGYIFPGKDFWHLQFMEVLLVAVSFQRPLFVIILCYSLRHECLTGHHLTLMNLAFIVVRNSIFLPSNQPVNSLGKRSDWLCGQLFVCWRQVFVRIYAQKFGSHSFFLANETL